MTLRRICHLACLVLSFVILGIPGSDPAFAQLKMAPPRATPSEIEELREQFLAEPEVVENVVAYARALAAQNTISDRRKAVAVLKEGLRFHPESVDIRIALSDLYYRQGYLTLARQQLRKALEYSPDTSPAYSRLGRIAFRDWLKFQRTDALMVAQSFWERSTFKNPDDSESWLGLGILALIAADYKRAEECARVCISLASKNFIASEKQLGLFVEGAEGATPERAVASIDMRGEGWLMLGAAAYEQGKLVLADSAFSLALRYVSPSVRSHLLDITPLATPRDTLAYGLLRNDSAMRAEFLRQFWKSLDPDLTSSVNEVRLEHMARGAIAYFLYYNQRRQGWDERGRILVRYGVPQGSRYNPLDTGFPIAISTNRLVWSYPMLGMNVYLEDRYLNESYDLPISLHWDVDPTPMPDILQALTEMGEVAVAGRSVFRSRRPGTLRLPGEVRPAMFRRVKTFDPVTGVATGPQVGRLELYLSVSEIEAVGPIDAEAVILDSTWRELGRIETSGMSWCTSERDRVAQFNFELPAGNYTVGVTARDQEGRAEASWKLPVMVEPPLPGKLEISDIELACEFIPETLGGPFDKTLYSIVPSPRHEVPRHKPLGVYFEIYGLIPDDSGYSKVSVEYTIRSAEPDKRPFFLRLFNPKHGQARVQAVRTDETPGRVRFQYVSADLEDPEPGPYQLLVKVSDERSGQSIERELDFTVVR